MAPKKKKNKQKKEQEGEQFYKDIEDKVYQLNQQLAERSQFNHKECSYVTKYAYKEIEQQLQLFEGKGYDIDFDNNKKPFFQNKSNTHVYQISRMMKLRFKCKNNRCPYFEDAQRQKRWTSYWGLVVFSFYFQYQSKKQKQKYLPLLRYNLKIYGQKCLTCYEWGSGSIMATNMEHLCSLYSLILEIVLYEKITVEKETNLTGQVYLTEAEMKGKRSKKKRKGGARHKSELCEACEKGKCPYIKTLKNK